MAESETTEAGESRAETRASGHEPATRPASEPPAEAGSPSAPPSPTASAAPSTPPSPAPAPAHASERPAATAASAGKIRTSTKTPAAGADAKGGPLGAYEALAKSPRLSDLVTIAARIVGTAAESRRAEWSSAQKVADAADELKVSRADADTPYGNALKILESGPEGAAEDALACALWAHAVAESRREDEDRAAGDILWLATHTKFDATTLLDRALGENADELWKAIADRVKRVADGRGGTLGRGEALVGAAALASSEAPVAAKLRGELAGAVDDPILVRVLSQEGASGGRELRFEGALLPTPRGPVATTVLALTGILFVTSAARLVARVALAYRRPAEVSLTSAGVRVKTRTEMLGKVLREREHVIVRAGLVRVVREVRYPRAAFYAGLLALAVGSYVGVRSLVDGVRSASPSLLLVGLGIIVLGIAADFVLGSVLPGARGRCSVSFVPRSGATLCVGDVDPKRADDAIARTLASR